MQVANLTKSFYHTPPFFIDDIPQNPIQKAFFNKCLAHSIHQMNVAYGGDSFKKFQKDMESTQLRTNQLIEVHKTSLYPSQNGLSMSPQLLVMQRWQRLSLMSLLS
jgi:hypothetical protein